MSGVHKRSGPREWSVVYRFDNEGDARAFEELTRGLSDVRGLVHAQTKDRKANTSGTRLGRLVLAYLGEPGRREAHYVEIGAHAQEQRFSAGSVPPALTCLSREGLVERVGEGFCKLSVLGEELWRAK